jgi:phosphotransferase system HPr-like phosphotransfer protein
VLETTLKSLEGGPEMIASAATPRRELAHRSTNGIEVTLVWTESTNTVAIAVLDTHSGEELEFEVDGARALDAFNHPYAYAATGRLHSMQAAPLAPAR